MHHGSHISNCYFFEELSRTVGNQVAEEWIRKQVIIPRPLVRASSCSKAQNVMIEHDTASRNMPPGGGQKYSSCLIDSKTSQPKANFDHLPRVQVSMKDEIASIPFQQSKTLQALDIRRARDTSSLLSSLSSPRTAARLVKASCGASSAGHSTLGDRRGQAGNLGLLFTDAAHTILD